MTTNFSDGCNIGADMSKDNRPLADQEREMYELPQLDMFDRLSLSALLERLSQHGCLSREHVAAITQRVTQRQQVATLCDIMARRSLTHRRQFLDIVREAEQQSDVDRPVTGGEICVLQVLRLNTAFLVNRELTRKSKVTDS